MHICGQRADSRSDAEKLQLSGFCLEWEQIITSLSSSRKSRKNPLAEEEELQPTSASAEAKQTDVLDDYVQSRLMSINVCVRAVNVGVNFWRAVTCGVNCGVNVGVTIGVHFVNAWRETCENFDVHLSVLLKKTTRHKFTQQFTPIFTPRVHDNFHAHNSLRE